MFQALYFIVFVSAVIIGFIALTPRDPSSPSLMKRTVGQFNDPTGSNYRSVMQRFSIKTEKGIERVREQMRLVEEQNQFMLDRIKEERVALEEQRHKVREIMADYSRDVRFGARAGQLEELASAMEEQDRLLIANGQEIMAINDQIRRDMQGMKDQMEILDFKKDSNAQEVKDKARELSAKVEGLMEQQRAALERTRESQARARDGVLQMKQKLEDVSRSLRDQMELNSLKVDEARRKAEDQKQMMEDRIADQLQHLKDMRSDQIK